MARRETGDRRTHRAWKTWDDQLPNVITGCQARRAIRHYRGSPSTLADPHINNP